MAYALVTLFLFCFSLLPSAYLRYYPFRSIVQSPTRHVLLAAISTFSSLNSSYWEPCSAGAS